ncbi:glycosyl transferase, group 4 family protein [Cardiosporidium cionae]|uniref:UDP-N-acetylglucosamine--dolichyl-phosphate N-acetylglucosaminephosphotransferase n=1 Tax=Cardiosporidium cionae TaxID=476202 RepID=A0ABQ7J999_9APIC|nr:glycosyl transferase, group 4 family protein [Cardiosporidium cionae]|eukprot:KAF8820580.1 glycosyl transferase, group 4 family protein [Cardiosporidium cionae]
MALVNSTATTVQRTNSSTSDGVKVEETATPNLSPKKIFSFFLFPLAVSVCSVFGGSAFIYFIVIAILVSFLLYIATLLLIPIFMKKCHIKGFGGRDLNKISNAKVPEPLGIVPAMMYLLAVLFLQLVSNSDSLRLLEFNAALLSIALMTLLGFVDDMLDLPWRYKLVLPFFASIPILLSYSGSTIIVIPDFLREQMGYSINLGYLYHAYMAFLTVFCTNCINIYAGVNGLEAGQSCIMCVFVMIYNLIEIQKVLSAGDAMLKLTVGSALNQNIFSLLLSFPFLTVSLALLCFNWFPSKLFVGDTYTYFSGIYFAVASVLGHFSRTALLFFIPQLLNALYSIPQLLGIVYCPRHRVPRLNKETGKLEPTPNMTIINLALRIFGPMTEQSLVIVLLLFQVFCCTLGLLLRYSCLSTLFT